MKKYFLTAAVTILFSCGGSSGSDGGSGGSTGTGGGSSSGGGSTATGGAGNTGWHAIAVPTAQDRANVSGVYCTAPNKCVISTHQNASEPGAIFAATDTAVGEKLVDGTYPSAMTTAGGLLGDIDFEGFRATRTGVAALLRLSSLYVSAATGADITSKASWTFVGMGTTADNGQTFGLNVQAALQSNAAGKWAYINSGAYVMTSSTAPSPTTSWTKVWSPFGSPKFPADFVTQFMADPSLCEGDVTGASSPPLSQAAHISQDLNLMVLTSAALNQRSSPRTGVCISTDQGAHFNLAPFSNVIMNSSSPGPNGVTCVDNNKCFAFHGLEFDAETYIYFTNNASMGKSSTWTAGTIPADLKTGVSLSAVFFAPDGMHGWAVGNKNHSALVLRTTDGGATWTNVTASLGRKANGDGYSDLYNGFALDNDHVYLTGRFGTFLATATAQQ